MAYQGLFSLLSAQDLLKKVRADFLEMESNCADPYIAFNFFVTARCIPEWLYHDDKSKVHSLFESHVELRICRHLADGAKHFIATRKHHTQILSTKKQGIFDPNIFDSKMFDTTKLTVELSIEDSLALGVNQSITSVDLARKILSRLEKIVLA